MKLLSNLIGEIGAVVNTLSVSSKEKKQIEADLIAAIARQEEELRRSQAAIIGADVATKAAEVELVFVDRFSGSLIITGDVASVEASLKAVLDVLEHTLQFTPTSITRT